MHIYVYWKFMEPDISFTCKKSPCFLPVKTKETKQKTLSFIRSSRPEVFCKKGVLRNLTKFTGKHLFQGLFFNKVAGLRPETLLKKTLAQVLSCEFCKNSMNAFSYRTLPVAAFVS